MTAITPIGRFSKAITPLDSFNDGDHSAQPPVSSVGTVMTSTIAPRR